MRKCKNARVQVRIKLVDGGSYNGQWLFCTLFIISIVYIGIQTDYDEPAKYCDAGVQCEIGPIGYQRSCTPDRANTMFEHDR